MKMQPNDIMLVDKPVGFSSFQIIRILKRTYAKVGHTGTLDPFASGLLVILIGPATRRFTEFQSYEKEYHGEMVLGHVTDTYDITGRMLDHDARASGWSRDELQKIAREFVGRIEQVPPRFSALKQGGRKLYELSRAGKSVQPRKRHVHVKDFTVTMVAGRFIRFRTIVGKGTYIRSLVHDFGQRAGSGATCLALRRTRIEQYHVNAARSIGSLMNGAPE
jgi:tRNA pseudouridine55 synthase